MVSAEAADAAREDLHGNMIDGYALMVEKPPSARLMRCVQAQLKKARAAKPTPDSEKDREQNDAQTARRVGYTEKAHLIQRLRQMDETEEDDVPDLIAADVPDVTDTSERRVVLELDDLSNAVLLKILTYFRKRLDSQSKAVSQPAEEQAQSKDNLETPPLEPKTGKRSELEDQSGSVIKGGDKQKRPRAVTRWDLLRGLKCVAEEFVQVGTAVADEQFGRFFHPSVMGVPNLPTSAYTILRNELLADSIGRLLVQLSNVDGKAGLNQSNNIGTAGRDPVARRWKTFKRDFPDVAAMVSKLQPERDEIRAWVISGHHLSCSCFSIVAADEKPSEAIAQALGDRDLHGPNDLADFTRHLAEIDKDARFQLEKPQPADIDPREALCKELLELGIKINGRYPELSELISLGTEMPYQPNHEEGLFDDE